MAPPRAAAVGPVAAWLCVVRARLRGTTVSGGRWATDMRRSRQDEVDESGTSADVRRPQLIVGLHRIWGSGEWSLRPGGGATRFRCDRDWCTNIACDDVCTQSARTEKVAYSRNLTGTV